MSAKTESSSVGDEQIQMLKHIK